MSTDRTVGRILGFLHLARGCRCLSLASPFNASEESIGRTYCRVSPLANGIRRIVSRLEASRIPRARWHPANILRNSKSITGIPHIKLASAIRKAVLASAYDWAQEKEIFQAPPRPTRPPRGLVS